MPGSYAPFNTPRVIWVYKAVGVEHRMMFRGARGSSLGSLQTSATALGASLAAALQSLLDDEWVYTDGLVIPQDTNVGIPASPPASPTGAIDPATYTPIRKCYHLTFTGRTLAGGRVQYKVYAPFLSLETVGGPAENGVIEPGQSTPVDNARTAITGASWLVGADNSPVVLDNTVTLNINDSWEGKVRKGSIT